jgi:hypothetical protein
MGKYNLIGEEGTLRRGACMVDPTCALPDEEDEPLMPTSKPSSKSVKAKTCKRA